MLSPCWGDYVELYDPTNVPFGDGTFPDVYFGSGYGAAEEVAGAGSWRLISGHQGKWLLPFHIREVEGFRDATSPYGYAGVYAHASLTSAEHLHAWATAQEILKDLGVSALFLRQSPLLPNPFAAPPGRVVVDRHPTILVNTEDSDLAWGKMEGRSRTSIRKAVASDMAVHIAAATTDDLAPAGAFRTLYEATMRGRGAADRYLFPDAYYATLQQRLEDDLQIGHVRDGHGDVVAAALFLRHGVSLHYHLSGSTVSAGRLGATNLLIWGGIQWAAANGVMRLHLGGGLREGDSLFKFKRSFGGEPREFSAYGVIIDEDSYRESTALRAAQLGVTPEALDAGPYFPAFRSPR